MSLAIIVKAFGPAGVVSFVALVTSIIILAAFARSVMRPLRWKIALGLGIVGWLLARVASDRVSSIEVDRTEELEAARLYQKRLREEMEGFAFQRVRFAEDTESDRLDVAGLKKEELAALTGAVEKSEGPVPAYMADGKQQRTAGKKKQVSAASLASKDDSAAGLKMKERDVLAANRLDRYNLLVSNIVLLASLCAVGWDYARRFNRTIGGSMPLPLSSKWLQAISPPARTVLWRAPDMRQIRSYLETVVLRGETFAWYGNSPWEGSLPQSLPRVVFRSFRFGSCPVLVFGAADVPLEAEFFFDAVWFNRYAVVVTDPSEGQTMLEKWLDLCKSRRTKRARAGKMVHIIWGFDEPLPHDILSGMANMAESLNFKLVVTTPAAVTGEYGSFFSEII